MGLAVIRGMLAAGLVRPRQLVGFDPDPSRRAALRALRVRAAASNGSLTEASQVVLLAVKPQQMRAVLAEIAPFLNPKHLVTSVAAGWSTKAIEATLGRRVAVVRVMPNTPAQVRRGIAVLCRGTWATTASVEVARAIFMAVGGVLELPERLFHAVTAVSGSGPAYVFYLMEGMQEAGRRLKLPAKALRRLVVQTVLGSAHLAQETGQAPHVLRARVTSKGGTTEAAIKVFEEARMKAHLVAGIAAADRRSAELGH